MDLLQLESIVTTQLRVRVPKLLDNRFPSIKFTNEKSDEPSTFPCVYVHELEPSEVGNTIPNQEIHAVRDTIQIIVSTNTNKADASVIMNACINVMKVLRYSLVMGKIYDKTNNIHSYVIRMRRVVASGDEF